MRRIMTKREYIIEKGKELFDKLTLGVYGDLSAYPDNPKEVAIKVLKDSIESHTAIHCSGDKPSSIQFDLYEFKYALKNIVWYIFNEEYTKYFSDDVLVAIVNHLSDINSLHNLTKYNVCIEDILSSTIWLSLILYNYDNSDMQEKLKDLRISLISQIKEIKIVFSNPYIITEIITLLTNMNSDIKKAYIIFDKNDVIIENSKLPKNKWYDYNNSIHDMLGENGISIDSLKEAIKISEDSIFTDIDDNNPYCKIYNTKDGRLNNDTKVFDGTKEDLKNLINDIDDNDYIFSISHEVVNPNDIMITRAIKRKDGGVLQSSNNLGQLLSKDIDAIHTLYDDNLVSKIRNTLLSNALEDSDKKLLDELNNELVDNETDNITNLDISKFYPFYRDYSKWTKPGEYTDKYIDTLIKDMKITGFINYVKSDFINIVGIYKEILLFDRYTEENVSRIKRHLMAVLSHTKTMCDYGYCDMRSTFIKRIFDIGRDILNIIKDIKRIDDVIVSINNTVWVQLLLYTVMKHNELWIGCILNTEIDFKTDSVGINIHIPNPTYYMDIHDIIEDIYPDILPITTINTGVALSFELINDSDWLCRIDSLKSTKLDQQVLFSILKHRTNINKSDEESNNKEKEDTVDESNDIESSDQKVLHLKYDTIRESINNGTFIGKNFKEQGENNIMNSFGIKEKNSNMEDLNKMGDISIHDILRKVKEKTENIVGIPLPNSILTRPDEVSGTLFESIERFNSVVKLVGKLNCDIYDYTDDEDEYKKYIMGIIYDTILLILEHHKTKMNFKAVSCLYNALCKIYDTINIVKSDDEVSVLLDYVLWITYTAYCLDKGIPNESNEIIFDVDYDIGILTIEVGDIDSISHIENIIDNLDDDYMEIHFSIIRDNAYFETSYNLNMNDFILENQTPIKKYEGDDINPHDLFGLADSEYLSMIRKLTIDDAIKESDKKIMDELNQELEDDELDNNVPKDDILRKIKEMTEKIVGRPLLVNTIDTSNISVNTTPESIGRFSIFIEYIDSSFVSPYVNAEKGYIKDIIYNGVLLILKYHKNRMDYKIISRLYNSLYKIYDLINIGMTNNEMCPVLDYVLWILYTAYCLSKDNLTEPKEIGFDIDYDYETMTIEVDNADNVMYINKLLEDINRRYLGIRFSLVDDKTYFDRLCELDTSKFKPKKTIFCILGESGSGKDTLVKYTLDEFKLRLKTVVSYTDREKRENETYGIEHHFVSPDTMTELLENREIAAYTKIGDFRYCTLISDLEESDIYIIDPNGLNGLKSKYGDRFNFVAIYIDCPYGERRKRSENRSDFNLSFENRALAESGQFSEFRKSHGYDHVVDNGYHSTIYKSAMTLFDIFRSYRKDIR